MGIIILTTLGLLGLALLIAINVNGSTASLQQPPWNDRARRAANIAKARKPSVAYRLLMALQRKGL